MNLPRAMIFDMDGTLADTEEIHRQAFNRAFKEFNCGWEWSEPQYRQLLAISGGRERIRSFAMGRSVGNGDADRLAADVHRRKSEIYRELLGESHIALRPGVARLIDAARLSGVRLAVATSSSRRNLEKLLAGTLRAAPESIFESIVTSDVVSEKKPSPAVYLKVLAELSLPAADCVAIEDTRNGNLAALAAGLRTIITTHRYTVDDDFRGADLVINQLGEPESPFKILGGDARGSWCVDLDFLRRMFAAQRRTRETPGLAVNPVLAAK